MISLWLKRTLLSSQLLHLDIVLHNHLWNICFFAQTISWPKQSGKSRLGTIPWFWPISYPQEAAARLPHKHVVDLPLSTLAWRGAEEENQKQLCALGQRRLIWHTAKMQRCEIWSFSCTYAPHLFDLTKKSALTANQSTQKPNKWPDSRPNKPETLHIPCQAGTTPGPTTRKKLCFRQKPCSDHSSENTQRQTNTLLVSIVLSTRMEAGTPIGTPWPRKKASKQTNTNDICRIFPLQKIGHSGWTCAWTPPTYKPPRLFLFGQLKGGF